MKIMDIQCDKCSQLFQSEKKLNKHLETNKVCQKYQYILFTCEKCNLSFKGYDKLNEHLNDCNPIIIPDNNENIEKINNFKVSLYKEIIELNTNIKLPSEENNNLQKQFEDLQNIFNDQLKNKKDNIDKKDHDSIDENKKKKLRFKTLENVVELDKEPSEEDNNNKIKDIKNNFLSSERKKENYNETFDKLFEELRNSRVFTNYLNEIKKMRLNLLENISLSEYMTILESHLQTLNNIFDKKNMNEKKKTDTINKCLSSIDVRLLYYNKYYKVDLNISDELPRFRSCLDNSIEYPQQFKPFNREEFVSYFYNYGSVLFTLKENIERYLFNKYDFNNVIYIDLSTKDPYSFYTLDSINKNTRKWVLDLRLEDLSLYFISAVRPHFVDLFKKIYFDNFNDYIFRKDYNKFSPILEKDCEQLMQNILLLSSPIRFAKFLMKIVKEKSTKKPTNYDVVTSRSDDKIQKEKFEKTKDESNEYYNVLKSIFSNITYEEAVDFYREKSI